MPTEIDAEGPCDGVNGASRRVLADLVLYVDPMTRVTATRPIGGFDWDTNGPIDLPDVGRLLSNPSFVPSHVGYACGPRTVLAGEIHGTDPRYGRPLMAE